MSTKTLVLIGGGWHIPASYTKLVTKLRASGTEVHVPRLPSMNGAQPPTADLATDTDMIRSYVSALVEAGRVVVVAMHSYGGQVGTNALTGLSLSSRKKDGLPGGIASLVYFCAFALPEGQGMMSKVKEFGHEHLIPLAFDIADDGSCVHRDPKTLLVGEGVSDDEAAAYVDTLVRWNGNAMHQGLDRCAWRELPVTYLYTTGDMTVPYDYQKSMVEKLQAEGTKVQTVELATGHSPNLTATEELVKAINDVLAS